MTKLLQVAVPVVLALLCLIPTVDAPTRTGIHEGIRLRECDSGTAWNEVKTGDCPLTSPTQDIQPVMRCTRASRRAVSSSKKPRRLQRKRLKICSRSNIILLLLLLLLSGDIETNPGPITSMNSPSICGKERAHHRRLAPLTFVPRSWMSIVLWQTEVAITGDEVAQKQILIYNLDMCYAVVECAPVPKVIKDMTKRKLTQFRFQQCYRPGWVTLAYMADPSIVWIIVMLITIRNQRNQQEWNRNEGACQVTKQYICCTMLHCNKVDENWTRCKPRVFESEEDTARNIHMYLQTAVSIFCHLCVSAVVITMSLILSGDIEKNPGPLTSGDLKKVLDSLWEARTEWFYIGIQLDMRTSDLKVIKKDHDEAGLCFTEMLTDWLKRMHPPPTWEALVDALKSQTVGYEQLADTIQKTHCKKIDPPQITQHPSNQLNVVCGSQVTFTVAATTDAGTLTYLWQRNGASLDPSPVGVSGATTNTLTIDSVQESNTGVYTCVVSNAPMSTATSNAAKLTLLDPPQITQHPTNRMNVVPGSQVTFTVAANTDAGTLAYQWQLDGASLDPPPVGVSGAATNTLTIDSVQESNTGVYTCVVNNTPVSTTTSNGAQLTLIDPPQIINPQQQQQYPLLPSRQITGESQEDSPVHASDTNSSSQELQSGLQHEHNTTNKDNGASTGSSSVLSRHPPFLQLSASEQEELKAMLDDDVREMKRQFSFLVTKTRDSVEERIPVGKYATSILALGAYEPVPEERNQSLLNDHREEIKKTESISEIFNILSAYWNYLNYEILEDTIELYGTSDDKKRLESYNERLQKFCKRRIFELSLPESSSSSGNTLSSKLKKLAVKLNVCEDITCNELLRIRSRIAKILQVKRATLIIDGVDAGCVQLTLLIPKFVAQEIFPLSDEQISALHKDASVIRLECGDYVFENVRNTSTEDQIITSLALEGLEESGSVPLPALLQPDSQLANPSGTYSPQQPHTEYQPTFSQYPLPQLPYGGYQSILAQYPLPQLSHSSHQLTFPQYLPPQRPHGGYQLTPAQYPLLHQPHGGYQQLFAQYQLPQQPHRAPSQPLHQDAQVQESGQQAQHAHPNNHSGSTSTPTSEKPPFGCGCGKCTFFSFLERGCPKPIPSASSFPYLDLSGLTHEQQQELRGRLCFESQEMMMKFQKLVSATILSFKRHQIPLHELRSHVMTLGAFSPVHEGPQRPALDNHFKDLQTANTVSEIFWLLRDNLSFFNYHILEHMITVLGTEEDNENLRRYKKQFQQYAKRRMYECLPQFGPVCETGYADIFVKVDSHYEMYTVTEVEILRCQLSEILHISSHGVLHLCRVEKGCFQLTFQVPSFVQQAIFPLSSKQERQLAEKGVIRLVCDEYQFIRKECQHLHHKSSKDETSDDNSAERQKRDIADTDATGQSFAGVPDASELNSTPQAGQSAADATDDSEASSTPLDHSEFQSMRLDPEEENKTIRSKYANTLKEKYRSGVPTFLTLQWPPPPTLKVFNLAMISQRELQYGADDELVRLLLKGSVSDVVSQRNEVKLEQISDSLHSKGRKVILIEGAPGAGKSTLSWHLCKMWEAGKLFQEFEIVLFVQLRELATQSPRSLEDLFPAESLSKKEAISAIQYCGGHQVLIVLDSWDEFPPGLDQDSIIRELICNPSKLNMQFSALIITSRPVATGRLQRYTSTRIQIAGFVQSEVKRYFTEAIKDPQMVQKLSDQLKERPIIEASCYLPLNTVIIAHIFLAENHTLPTTLHGVFTSLVLCCIIRHMEKQGKSLKISSLDCLPPNIQEPFNNLCTLAYHGVRKNKATFSEEDLKLSNLPTELTTLSLMQGVASFSTFGESRLYNFLHLSTQELLAAFFITKMQPEEQLKVFNELFEQPRFSNVFKFYAAFTKLQTEGIRDTVSSVVKSRNTTLLLSLLHCLYEAQDNTLCQFVAAQAERELDLSDEPLSPVDCLTVGYFARTVCSTEKLKLTFTIDGIDKYSASLIVKELLKSPDTKPQTVMETGSLDLTLKSTEIHNSPARKLICNSIICKLDLNLSDGQIQAAELADALAEVNRNLTALNLSENRIGDDGARCLSAALVNMVNLQELDLQNNQISPQGCEAIAIGLKHCTKLEYLNLQNNQISPQGCEAIANGLKHCTKLEYLNLSYNHIEIRGALVAMEKMVHLQELDLRNNELGDEGVQMAVEKMVHFQELDLSGDEREAGRAKPAMKKLWLIQCRIGDGGMKLLSTCMEKMVNLQELHLTMNVITDAGCSVLCAALKECKNLQQLDLWNNRLMDSSVEPLCQLIKTAKCLKKLGLQWNQFTREGKTQLREAVKERNSYPDFVELQIAVQYYDF